MTTRAAPSPTPPAAKPQWGLAWAGLLALAVAGGLAGYAHKTVGRGAGPLFTLGFSSTIVMKAWLTSIAMVFVIIQLITALAMWGRLPGVKAAGNGWSVAHRWSGTVAFLISLPVAFTCVYSLGFGTENVRTITHSAAGCLFYGIFAAKMLSLRMKRLPGWTLPVLGGLLVVLLVTIWFTAAFWYFSQPNVPTY